MKRTHFSELSISRFSTYIGKARPSSSGEMIILRNNSQGEVIRVCIGIFTTALRNKKYVKFSIKISHLSYTAYHLISDRLLSWKEPILASCPFRGFPHTLKCRIDGQFHDCYWLLSATIFNLTLRSYEWRRALGIFAIEHEVEVKLLLFMMSLTEF